MGRSRVAYMNNIKGLLKGDKRVIARIVSAVEDDKGDDLLESIFPHTGHSYHIGITGPPGAGKSTLVTAIAKRLLGCNKKVGIIAVDPSSPFSGGALLGDRVRMTDLALNDNIFIRSMASRGSMGGLAQATKDVALVLDAAGMDYVLIETIGVGQVELDIAQVCDTTIVVLVPESGDSIQAMKAGLLEIADIMVVNKGDREGSERLIMELKFAFEMREKEVGWDNPILKTTATKDEGIEELVLALESHEKHLTKTGKLEQERKKKLLLRMHELIERRIRVHLQKKVIPENEIKQLMESMYKRQLNPYRVAKRIARRIIRGSR
jgi:LAO/AO transport system kinase